MKELFHLFSVFCQFTIDFQKRGIGKIGTILLGLVFLEQVVSQIKDIPVFLSLEEKLFFPGKKIAKGEIGVLKVDASLFFPSFHFFIEVPVSFSVGGKAPMFAYSVMVDKLP